MPYAKVMAEGLAFLWRRARVDANDVEFVLAGLPGSDHDDGTGNRNDEDDNGNDEDHRGRESERGEPMSAVFESDTLGRHAMWVLDFDCCKPLAMDDSGVEEAARSF